MSRTNHARPPASHDHARRLLTQRSPAEVVLSAAALLQAASRRRGVTRDQRERLEELVGEAEMIATELVAKEAARG